MNFSQAKHTKPCLYDAIILGTGIAGLGCGIALARAGKKVLMIDRKLSAGEATPAAAGILDPVLAMHPASPLLVLGLKAFARYPAMIRRLHRESGVKTDYEKIGMLYVAMSGREGRALKRKYRWQSRLGISMIWKDRNALQKEYSGISASAQGGLYYPDISRVNPQKLKRALLKLARNLGVRMIKIHQFNLDLSGRHVLKTLLWNRRRFEAPHVINAMGSWSGRIPLGGMRVPVKPVRGQIMILKGRLPLTTMIHSLDRTYIVPWKRGQFLIGSTLESAGFASRVTASGLRKIRTSLEKMVPAVRGFKRIQSWAGLRPYPKDQRPLIGPTPVTGYYFATGYYRSGILIGMYAGELLARGILSGKMPSILSGFNPQRFFKKGRSNKGA